MSNENNNCVTVSQPDNSYVPSGSSVGIYPNYSFGYYPYVEPKLTLRQDMAYRFMKDFLSQTMALRGATNEEIIREAYRLADLFFAVANEPVVDESDV